ncbi:hypothetical protein BH09GEM1_BH09GEM1_40920 [soil metagenome]
MPSCDRARPHTSIRFLRNGPRDGQPRWNFPQALELATLPTTFALTSLTDSPDMHTLLIAIRPLDFPVAASLRPPVQSDSDS